MSEYTVAVRTVNTEYWAVSAMSKDEATQEWSAGSLIDSELLDSEVQSVELFDN